MKAICIKSNIFQYRHGGIQFEVERGKIYEYYRDNCVFYLRDENKRSFYYDKIIADYEMRIDFDEYFVDIEEYREQKINEILSS